MQFKFAWQAKNIGKKNLLLTVAEDNIILMIGLIICGKET